MMVALAYLLLATVFFSATFWVQSAPTISCTNQILEVIPTGMGFTNCADLGTLESYLQWTYDNTTSKLRVAFTSTMNLDRWVAWGINPVRSGMIGAEVFGSFRAENGTVVVNRYELSNYVAAKEVQTLSTYSDSNLLADLNESLATIFGTVLLPEGTMKINITWQMGTLAGFMLHQHETKPDNINSKYELDLSDFKTPFFTGSPPPSDGSSGDEAHRHISIISLVVFVISSQNFL